MKLSDILLLLKGKRAAVGEIRNWKGGSYIKTVTGWKPHEKKYSPKYVERKNNAASKKDSDLRKRQSEVARLSGEIQGHKAAVEHHTSQGTKQDERQAKHHAIRAQVKQRRLDKHKEILEQRHGVKDEVKEPEKKKQFNFSKPLSLNSIQNNAWGKQPENLSDDDLLKTYAYVEYANYAIRRNLINAPTGKTHILPQIGGQDNLNAFKKEIEKRGLNDSFEIDIDLSQTPVKSPEAKANFEKWKAERQEEKPKETPVKQKELSQRNSFLKDRYEAGHSLSDIFKELKKDYQRDPATANAIFTDFIKSQKESGNQKLMNEFNGTSFIENIHDTPQYKEMLIRHGIDPSDPYKEKEQPKPKGIPQSISDFKINAKDLSIKNNNIEKPTPNPYKVGDLMYDGMDETDDTGYVYEMKMVDPNTIDYTEKYQSEDTVINDPTTQKYIEWFKQGIQPMPIQVIKHQDSGKLLSINRRRLLAAKQAGVKIPAFVEIGKYKDLKSKPTTPQGQPKPKENVIPSGSRGATIAGQQYSKREVDILNSLDDIINRAKSPVVQDLLKKRQSAKIELPSKELGQPKLEAHESKFMELVKRNRSQADKQAGYPEERRKVEAETGVKIPKEKAVEMTKHMKASFIWDIKKPSLFR